MTHAELIEKLEQLVIRCGSQKAAAARIGVGLTTLNRTIKRRIGPGDKLLVGMGLGLSSDVLDVMDAHYPVVDRIRYDHVMEVR